MKRKIITLLVMTIMLFPFSAKAETTEYHSMNLEQVLTEEGIEHDLSGYTETDDQAIIYLFRGKGCTYCRSFLTFLNSIVSEYGKYFKVVSYEVWEDTDNMPLLNGVSKTLQVEVGGVPFIVIGDKYFPGYANVYDDQIKQAIMDLYESKEKTDIMADALKNAGSEGYVDPSLENESGNNGTYNTSKSDSVDTASVILWNFVFVALGTIICLIASYVQNKRTEEKLEDLMIEMKKQKKTKKD